MGERPGRRCLPYLWSSNRHDSHYHEHFNYNNTHRIFHEVRQPFTVFELARSEGVRLLKSMPRNDVLQDRLQHLLQKMGAALTVLRRVSALNLEEHPELESTRPSRH